MGEHGRSARTNELRPRACVESYSGYQGGPDVHAGKIGEQQPGEAKTPSSVAEHYINLLLRGQVSPQTRATLDKSLSSPEIARADTGGTQIDQAKIVGLILGSPEFQRQ